MIRAQTSEEVFDWARALAWCPLPKGPRVAVLTNAGGPGAIAVDSLDANGLPLAELGQDTLKKLRAFLPAAASVSNPVDMLAAAGPLEYANGLTALLADDGVDSVMVVLPPPPVGTATDVAGAIIPIVKGSIKPVVVALMGEDLIVNAARLLRHSRIPDYRFPERAASALRVLWWRSRQMADQPQPVEAEERMPVDRVAQILGAARAGADGFVAGTVAAEALAAYGLAGPASEVAPTPEQAAAAAGRIGFPVVLKIASADLPHKSDVGGVRLSLGDEDSVQRAFLEMREAARQARPEARLDGVEVQAMVRGGQEVILGAVHDDDFGPLLMFGSGGVEVESRRDVAFALAPVNRREAGELINSTWAGRRLAGGRGVEPGDRGAVLEGLVRLSRFMLDHPGVAEVEVNPLRVMTQGVLVLDARLRLKPEGELARQS